MFDSLKRRIELSLSRRNWRKRNKDNYTVMGDMFNPDLVCVGKGSYGILNIINHSDTYKIKIGCFCSIAPNVSFIVCGEHRLDTLSTYPFRARYLGCRFEAMSKGDIVIEDDVWICESAIILSGVSIGQGAVVAAGSVVTKNVPPYAVVAGNPAQIIKYRFSEELIKVLMRIDYSKLSKQMIYEHENDLYRSLTDIDQISWMPVKS